MFWKILFTWYVLSLPLYVWIMWFMHSTWGLEYLAQTKSRGDGVVAIIIAAFALPWYVFDPVVSIVYRICTGRWDWYVTKAKLQTVNTHIDWRIWYDINYRN